MKIDELMTFSVLTATPDTSLAMAWRLMEDHRIRHLPVVSSGCLVGLVTDRDILSLSPATAIPHTQAELSVYMGTTPIESCMTQEVVTVQPEATLIVATQKMLDGRFGCLPVLDQGRLVGIITEIDLLRGYLTATTPSKRRMTVKDAMQDLLIIVTPEDMVSTAYQRMRGGIVRHLPILDDADKLIGVITDRDVRLAGDFGEVSLLASELTERFGMMTVNDLMTTQVVTVRTDTGLTEAAELFLIHKFGCLPVTRGDDTLEGILTVADLLGQFLDLTDSGRAKT